MNFFFVSSDTVQSLRLPIIRRETINDDFQTLELASWGFYSNENILSDSLRVVEMKIISSEECSTVYPTKLITTSVFCTENSHCSGDSGSALVNKNNLGVYTAVGLASFSFENCMEEQVKPSVFMKISSYIDFIRGTLDLNED